MHHRQQHADAREHEQDAVEFSPRLFHAEPLEHRRRELDEQHQRVREDAERRLQQDRVHVEQPRQHDVVALPVASEIDEHRQPAETVTEKRGHQAGARHGVVFAPVENVDDERHGEAAAPERGADNQVDGDPDSPGVAVIEVGGGAEAEDKALGENDGGDENDDQQNDEGRGDDPAADPGMFMCAHCFSPVPRS